MHDVLLALAAQQTLRLGVGQRAAGLEIVKGDDLGADEAALKIGVDLARGLRGLGALLDGPGAAFVAARGQEGDEAQQLVAALDQPVQTRLLQAQLFHEHGLFVRIVELGDVGLELCADRQHLAALLRGQRLHLGEIAAALGGIDVGLAEVRGVDRLAERQQVARGDHGGVILGAFERAGEIALVHIVAQGREDLDLVVEALVAALGVFLRLVDAAVDHLKVGHDELGVDDVDVAQRVGRALDVGDVGIVEAAHDVDDRVAAADVGQELVAQTLALRRALDQTRDVDELDDGGGELLGVMLVAQPLEPRIRHGHDADVRVDGAERIIIRRDARVRNGVEQRGLAHIRQPDDT